MSRVAGVVKEFIEDARGGLGYVVHEQYRAEQCQGPRAVKHSLAELDIAQSLLRKIVECAESVRRHGD